MNHNPPFEIMSPKEAAEYIGRSVSTLREWRKSGEGPPWIRRGRIIEYRRDKIDEWLDAPWTYTMEHPHTS